MLNESGCNLRAQPGSCDHRFESRKWSQARLHLQKSLLCVFLLLLPICALHGPCLSLVSSGLADTCDSAELSSSYLELLAINQDTHHSSAAVCSSPFLTSPELRCSSTCHLVACLMESITWAMLPVSHHRSSLLKKEDVALGDGKADVLPVFQPSPAGHGQQQVTPLSTCSTHSLSC